MTPRLFLTVLSMEMRLAFSYRFDFWVSTILGFVLPVALSLFIWQAIFSESGSEVIAGYTYSGMIVYYILVWLVGQFVQGGEDLTDISDEIYDGSLTKYILYPMSYFLFKYASHLSHIAISFVQVLVFGTLAHLFFGILNDISFTPAALLAGVMALMMANFLHFVLAWPLEAVAFWQDNVWSLHAMTRFLSYFLGGVFVPLAVFPEGMREVLRWLPFEYLYSFPVRVITGETTSVETLRGFIVCAVWIVIVGIITRIVWARGDRQYTGVGI